MHNQALAFRALSKEGEAMGLTANQTALEREGGREGGRAVQVCIREEGTHGVWSAELSPVHLKRHTTRLPLYFVSALYPPSLCALGAYHDLEL